VSIEFEQGRAGTWDPVGFGFQLVTLVAGFGLALTAFVALGGLGTEDAARQTTTSAQRGWEGTRAYSPFPMTQVVFYLVESKEQANMVESAIAQTAMERGGLANSSGRDELSLDSHVVYGVISTETPEGQLAAEHILGAGASEIADFAVSLAIVDLRSR
jgi:hypothetical protein